MLFTRRNRAMVDATDALPGRAQELPVAERHAVLGTPLKGSFPEGVQSAIFAMGCFWGAERIFWETEGVFTTAVGYGTLMLSANGGIRAFGEAALLGEIACIGVALLACPAWLTLLRERDVRKTARRNVSAPLPGPS